MTKLEWALGILLVILLLVVAVLSFMFWFRTGNSAVNVTPNSATVIAQRADDIAPTPAYAGKTAQAAFVLAQPVAQAWQADARLWQASATFPQGASAEELKEGEIAWGFVFYAPGTGKTAVISVTGDQASLISEGSMQLDTPPLDISGWKLDSRDAVQLFLDAGGADFIAQEGITTLTMTLSLGNQSGNNRMEWLISLFATQNGRSFTMRIDATSGEILETTS
ncbi:MAG: hypothetical protein D6706_11925 [Chloroflexi bacterium]|nr:MAG: hypothetical protein D6706_11925 [Chloroflexota bacterium]